MNTTPLNAYSQRFAAVLFAAYPRWHEFATVDTTEGVDEGALLVEISPPETAVRRELRGPLRISTDEQQITVGFDVYHTHFNRYAAELEAEAFADALAFLEDLLAERIAVASWWDCDEWRGSTTVATGAELSTPEWARAAKAVRVRSWRGTYDQDVEA